MLDQIQALFPAYTHPLTIVHDPDGILADEELAAVLAGQGCRLVAEPDPVQLRWRVEEAAARLL